MLRAACLRQRLAAEAAQRVELQVGSVPIDVVRQPAAALEFVGLALRFELSTYDATYVALVLRLQLSVARGDGPLRAPALAGGADVAGDALMDGRLPPAPDRHQPPTTNCRREFAIRSAN